MKKLKFEAYNGEIAHCQGRYIKCCHGCLRGALYLTWTSLPLTERESIILLVPRVNDDGSCPNKISMPRGYADTKSTRARIALTSHSGGVAI